MKNKFLNLNILLLLFLCLIGFSPQSNSLFSINTVYALDNVDSILTNTDDNGNVVSGINNDKFSSQVGGLIDGLNTSRADDLKKNISAGVNLMTDTLSNISTAASGFALTLSVVIVAIIGFKVINSGTGDVLTFMKQKKDISNAIVCIIFILAIPYFVRSVLEFKPPEILFSSVDSSIGGDTNIGDIVSTPKSGLKEYITTNQDIFKGTDEDRFNYKDFWEGNISTGEEAFANGLTGIVKMLWSALLSLFAGILYAPFLLLTSYIGSISFFPVSLDATMYEVGAGTVAQLAVSFFDTTSQSGMSGVGTNIIPSVATGLASLTSILNILYFLIKKFVMLCLEFVCYYFGIMHLLNKEKDDVGKFLVRLAQGVVGITLFPYLIEFLLDVDGIIATAILRITGPALPGFSIMSTLPTVDQAGKGFTILILSIIMCGLVFSLAKSFFVRRVEISLLYVASPVFFLKHMMSSNDGSVKYLTNTMISSIFLTTTYAPVLAIINLLLSFGIASSDVGMIYFMLVIGVLRLGKDVILNIIRKLTGESASLSNSTQQLSKGLSGQNLVASGAKFVAGALAFGATTAALNNGGSIKDAVKNAPKTLTDRETWKKAGKTITSKKSWQNGAKAVGSGVMRTGKRALNVAENQFWEKYNKAEKRYGKFNATEAETSVLKNRMGYNYKKIDREDELNETKALNNLYNSKDDDVRKNMARYDSFYKNRKRQKEAYVDFLENANSSKEKTKKMVDKTGNPDIKASFDEYLDVLSSTEKLMVDRDNLLKEGNIVEAFEADKKIQNNTKFMKRHEDSIHSVCAYNEMLKTREKGLPPLKVLSKNVAAIKKPDIAITGNKEAIISSMNSMKGLETFKDTESAKQIDSIIKLASSSETLGQAQSEVQKFIANHGATANFSPEDRKEFNKHVESMFEISLNPEQVNSATVKTPSIKFDAGKVRASMESLKEIPAFKNNEASMAEINKIISLTDTNSVKDIHSAVNSFVATQLSGNTLSVNDSYAFKKSLEGVYNGNVSDIQQHAIKIQDSSNEVGEEYYKQISALASGKKTDILDYIAVSSGSNSIKHQESLRIAKENNIKDIKDNLLKQHASIVIEGVGMDENIKNSNYGKIVEKMDGNSFDITDYLVMSSGQNEANYNSVAESIAKTICGTGVHSTITSILDKEFETKFTPGSTEKFSFDDLNNCISKAGGPETLKGAYVALNNSCFKLSGTAKEKMYNMPKAVNYDVTIEPDATSSSGSNNTNNSGSDGNSNGREDNK